MLCQQYCFICHEFYCTICFDLQLYAVNFTVMLFYTVLQSLSYPIHFTILCAVTTIYSEFHFTTICSGFHCNANDKSVCNDSFSCLTNFT